MCEESYKEKRIAHFGKFLKKIEGDYDLIIIDCPPTISLYPNTALYTADFLIIVLQTQQRSLDGAEAFWEYAQTFYDKYNNVDFDIAGVLPVLMKNDSGVDNQIIKDALEIFGKRYVFEHMVKHMERLKGYDRRGIADKDFTDNWDFHDVKLHDFYAELTEEFLQRIGE